MWASIASKLTRGFSAVLCGVVLLAIPHEVIAQSKFSEPTRITLEHEKLKPLKPIDRAEADELARQWSEVLNRGRSGARVRAARELAKMGTNAESAIESLLLALTDGEATVRLHAAQAIGSTGVSPDRCIPALNAILDDEDSHVRYAAEHALAQFAMQPVKLSDAKNRLQHLAVTSKELRASCQSVSNRLVVDEAVVRLQRLLAAHLDDADGLPVLPRSNSPAPPSQADLGATPRVDRVARTKASSVDSDDLESRILRFESAESIERLRMIDQLGLHAAVEPSRLSQIRADVLTSVLKRNDLAELDLISVRWPQVGQESFRKVFQRAGALQVQPGWMARGLKQVRCEQYPDLLRLLQIAKNKQNPIAVRTAALGALGRTSTLESKVLVEIHQFAFGSELERQVRLSALSAIGELGTRVEVPSKVLTRLWTVLEDSEQNWDIRMASARCLAKTSVESSRLEEAFFALLKHPHQDEEIAVALKVIPKLAVEKRHVSVMVTALSQELQASDESLRLLALRSARRVGPDEELVQALLLRLAANGETEAVTTEILQTLVQFGSESLKKVSEILSSPRLRDEKKIALLDGLAGLGEAAFPLRSDCSELVRDQRQGLRVRVAAAVVLGKIGGRAIGCQGDLEEFYAQMSHPSARAIVQIALSELTGGKSKLEMGNGPAATPRLYARFLEGDKSICPLLVSLLGGPDAEYASEALLDLGEPAADSLENLLVDETADLETRTVAAKLLTRLPNKSYRRLIDHVDEPGIGEVCEQCLAELEVCDKETEFVHNFAMKLQEAKDVSQRRELKSMAQDVVLASASVAEIDNVSGANAGLRLVGRLRADIAPNLIVAASADPETTMDELASSGERNMASPPVSAFPALPSLPEWPAASDAAIAGDGMAARSNSADASEAGSVGEDPLPLPNLALPADETFDMSSSDASRDLAFEEAEVTSAAERESEVTVYYGTNRKVLADDAGPVAAAWRYLILSLGAICIFSVWCVGILRRQLLRYGAVGLIGCGALAIWFTSLPVLARRADAIGMTRYGGELGTELVVGKCKVSIPDNHQHGELESASLLKLEFAEDPEKHIVLQDTQPLEKSEFLEDLRGTLDQRGNSLLVFIHGYNVSFEDAARRTAQMSYDLEFSGAAAFYSWPSQDNWYKYQLDRKNIQLSVKWIREFLTKLANESGAESIHLVAHSMGNVGLTEALANIEMQSKPLFNQVVLAAPDIDADIFRQNIAPEIVGKAENLTLYTSQSDLALLASRYFNSGKRVGESQAGVQFDGIDVIDASAVDTSLLGHNYYGEDSVLTDLRELLEARPLGERTFLKTRQISGKIQHFLESSRVAGQRPLTEVR